MSRCCAERDWWAVLRLPSSRPSPAPKHPALKQSTETTEKTKVNCVYYLWRARRPSVTALYEKGSTDMDSMSHAPGAGAEFLEVPHRDVSWCWGTSYSQGYRKATNPICVQSHISGRSLSHNQEKAQYKHSHKPGRDSACNLRNSRLGYRNRILCNQ